MTAQPGILPVVAVDRASARPLYRQLYDGYREAIVTRRLRAGQRLPSTRTLAAELKISRIPVLNAFEQLLEEGYFESRVGSGTFVATSIPDEFFKPVRRTPATEPVSRPVRRVVARRPEALVGKGLKPWYKGRGPFSPGQPPVDAFPIKIWSRLIARHSRNPDPNLLNYGAQMGLASLREAVAEYLRTVRAVRCEAEQIMIVNGSQQALDLVARVLLDPGSPVWVEEPAYFGAQSVLKLAGARVVPVPVDEEGLNVSAGIARCPRARAAFVTPSHQFPLGLTMSASRRLQLLDWARRSGAWIVEDDYDSEFRYGTLPITALQGLDRDSRVIYIGTFTKTLLPSLRLGYLVLPADLVEHFVAVKKATDLFSPTFYQAVLTDFIREGHFARHVRKMRLLCGERRDALVQAIQREIPMLQVLGDQAGMYLVATLPDGWRDREICLRAASQGLWAGPLSECYLGKAPRPGLILGYGGSSVKQIGQGVVQLAGLLRSQPRKQANTSTHKG